MVCGPASLQDKATLIARAARLSNECCACLLDVSYVPRGRRRSCFVATNRT